MYWIVGLLIALAVVIQGSIVWADEKAKGPSCQDQLAQTSVQANNLVHDRALKEEALAKEQIVTYILKLKVAQLEKTIEEMKKAAEPKGEPKKTE